MEGVGLKKKIWFGGGVGFVGGREESCFWWVGLVGGSEGGVLFLVGRVCGREEGRGCCFCLGVEVFMEIRIRVVFKFWVLSIGRSELIVVCIYR